MTIEMKLDLDNEQMHALVSEAILRSLDEKKRDALIQATLEHLLKPNKQSYYSNKSPIEDLFLQAAERVAREVMTEMVRSDPRITAKIRELFVAGYERMLAGGEGVLINRIADSFARALANEKDER